MIQTHEHASEDRESQTRTNYSFLIAWQLCLKAIALDSGETYCYFPGAGIAEHIIRVAIAIEVAYGPARQASTSVV